MGAYTSKNILLSDSKFKFSILLVSTCLGDSEAYLEPCQTSMMELFCESTELFSKRTEHLFTEVYQRYISEVCYVET